MSKAEKNQEATQVIDAVSAAIANVCKVIEENRLNAKNAGVILSYGVNHSSHGVPVSFTCSVTIGTPASEERY